MNTEKGEKGEGFIKSVIIIKMTVSLVDLLNRFIKL